MGRMPVIVVTVAAFVWLAAFAMFGEAVHTQPARGLIAAMVGGAMSLVFARWGRSRSR